MTICAIIISKNEEEMIGECIDSLTFADEIIVVDGESTDGTAQVAKKKGANVIVHTFNDFSTQRTFALAQTKADWVVYIDADERVTNELAHELKNLIQSTTYSAFKIRRVNHYLGKPWPKEDLLERVFKKNRLKGWYGTVHESPSIDGEIGTATHPILHYTHRNLESMLEKTITWSDYEAKLRFDNHHPPITWWRVLRVGMTNFFEYFVAQKGFTAGTVGVIESVYQSFSMMITYCKLWELQRKNI